MCDKDTILSQNIDWYANPLPNGQQFTRPIQFFWEIFKTCEAVTHIRLLVRKHFWAHILPRSQRPSTQGGHNSWPATLFPNLVTLLNNETVPKFYRVHKGMHFNLQAFSQMENQDKMGARKSFKQKLQDATGGFTWKSDVSQFHPIFILWVIYCNILAGHAGAESIMDLFHVHGRLGLKHGAHT